MYKTKWLILWTLWAAKMIPHYTPELRVSNGLLRGFYSTDGLYKAYTGIPYATVNRHYRFKEAGPEPLWDGVFDAIDEHVACVQRNNLVTSFGREDCLVLNVFTPVDATRGDRLPVMVYIHGGSFFEGSAHRLLYGPDFLVPKGVILVNLNYRLNIQGFLCLGTKDAPGNAGLKDQVKALKWVQRNVAAFGGDPDKVTLFGESAGAASVSYHLLSPMSRGLFHKAILQSGSSLAAWAHQFNPVYLASLLARTMGFNTMDPHELYNFFMNKTDEELVLTRVPRLEGGSTLTELLYSPCTEQVIDGIEPFLTEYPYDVINRGDFMKLPIIIGSNSAEGLMFVAQENDTCIAKMKFQNLLPKNVHFPNQNEKEAVAAKLEQMYFHGENITNKTMAKLADYFGETFFTYPIFMESEFLMQLNENPVYSYVFGYSGWRNIVKLFLANHVDYIPGASHADDLGYIFLLHAVPLRLPLEKAMVNKMTTMWTNFAKFSDPTPSITDATPLRWSPLTSSTKECLYIDDVMTMRPMWHNDRLKYWKEVYTKYRRKS